MLLGISRVALVSGRRRLFSPSGRLSSVPTDSQNSLAADPCSPSAACCQEFHCKFRVNPSVPPVLFFSLGQIPPGEEFTNGDITQKGILLQDLFHFCV